MKNNFTLHEFYFFLQVFPGTLLPYNYADPQNPDHLLARSEVERRRDYIQPLHVLVGEEHPLVQLVHQCLHNTPARRPSAEELLQQLEAVRAQIEGPYGQSVRVIVDMEKVRALREKDTEIRRLQQQMHQLEVGNVYTCNIKIPMQTYKWGMTGLYNVLALHSFPCILAAGRDGGERYPTPADERSAPAEGWSNSATRRRTSREDSSTQQAT